MPHERNPDSDSLPKPQEQRPRPNPKEDLSIYSQPRERDEEFFGPDGNGESPETDNEFSLGRGAD